MGTEVPGLWTAEEVAAERPASSQVLPGPLAPEPLAPKNIHSHGQKYGAINRKMSRPFRNIQVLARPTLKLHLFLCVNIFVLFFKVHFTFSSRVLCLLVSALICFHSTLHDHGRSLLLEGCVHTGGGDTRGIGDPGEKPGVGLCS